MQWDVELSPRAEVSLTFPDEGLFRYAVQPVGGGGDQHIGTITVDTHSFSSGVEVILILDNMLQPTDVTIKADRSLIWKNRRREAVRFFSLSEV